MKFILLRHSNRFINLNLAASVTNDQLADQDLKNKIYLQNISVSQFARMKSRLMSFKKVPLKSLSNHNYMACVPSWRSEKQRPKVTVPVRLSTSFSTSKVRTEGNVISIAVTHPSIQRRTGAAVVLDFPEFQCYHGYCNKLLTMLRMVLPQSVLEKIWGKMH